MKNLMPDCAAQRKDVYSAVGICWINIFQTDVVCGRLEPSGSASPVCLKVRVVLKGEELKQRVSDEPGGCRLQGLLWTGNHEKLL